MELKLINISSVIELRDGIAGLTKLDFSVYDQMGRLIVSSASEDPLSVIARDEYDNFVRSCIGKAILRKDFSMFKGPMNQYQCFIPAQIGDEWLVLAGNSFYTSAKDMDDFFVSKGPGYGLSSQELRSWAKRMVFSGMGSGSEMCRNIHRLFNLLVRDNHEKNLNRERYRKIRTIMDIFSDIDQNLTEEKVFSLLCDAIIFLFGGDTVSIMTRTYKKFTPALTAGRAKEHVESIPLKTDNIIVSDAVKNRKPVICAEAMELLRFGYPEDVTSMHIFPISLKDETVGLLSVFNSQFSEDDIDSISKLCSFAGFMLENINSKKTYMRHIRDLAAIDIALLNFASFKDADTLYEYIVEVASKYLNAEKASLMLPEEDSQELFIKAVKGMNKWIAKNIRVRIGEGIAGKVYKEGNPMIISDIEKNLSTKKRPNYKTGSFVSVPLKIGDEAIGVLNLSDKLTGEVFSETDMEFLRYFASYASISIKGAYYYRISEQMRTLSVTDSLTGLFNRRYFDDRLFEELQRATRYDYIFSLAIFDIDDFKLFNDTEGHLAGDEVLKAIANISRESLRSIDIIARFGGEEFSIIMPQTDRDEAFLVTERLRKNIKELMPLRWKNFPRDKITVSIGVAMFPEDGKDAKTLIRSADMALYKAKMSGKDKTVVWEIPNTPSHKTPFHNAG